MSKQYFSAIHVFYTASYHVCSFIAPLRGYLILLVSSPPLARSLTRTCCWSSTTLRTTRSRCPQGLSTSASSGGSTNWTMMAGKGFGQLFSGWLVSARERLSWTAGECLLPTEHWRTGECWGPTALDGWFVLGRHCALDCY